MRWKRWISVTPLAMTAVAPVVTWVVFPATTQAADDNDLIARLSATVNAGPAAVTSEDRQVAANQLVARDTPAARAAVLNALKAISNPTAQTATAKAVAQAQHPGETLIPALSDLLGSNPALTGAAASALANFPGNPTALAALVKFAEIPTTPEPVRESVILAIGDLIDKPAADYLFNLANRPNLSTAIQTTAFQALAEMTGISDYGSDQRLWKQWWDTMAVKTPEQFRAALLQTRARKFNEMKRRNQLLAESSRKLLLDDFRAMKPENQPDALIAYLNDPAPEIRSVGVTLVGLYRQSIPPTEKVRQRLFQLIADSDEKVRADVDKLLLTLNDPASTQALINQLGIEKDPKVAQTIAQILGNLKDPNAAPDAAKALIPMLHDPHPDSVIYAAKALAGLGENVRRKDPKLADDLSGQIRAILKSIDNQPGTSAMRATCVSALAELRDPNSLDTFRDCVQQPGETTEVRRAALIGMGNLGDARANQIVINCLDAREDPSIRLAAAHALLTVATPDQDNTLFTLMKTDRDPDVARELWLAFQALSDKMDKGQLQHWATAFDDQPDRKLFMLDKLGDRLRKDKDYPQNASNDQEMAAAMMALKPTPRVNDAIAHLQLALDYWRGPGKGTSGGDEALETLVGQMLDYKLTAEQWGPACAFAAEQIAINGVYQLTVGPRIRDKVDELIKANNIAAAQKLIDAAVAMKPPLDQKYAREIQRAQNDLKERPSGP